MIDALKYWAPVEIDVSPKTPVVKWRDLKTVEFLEPFFSQTVRRVRDEDPEGEISSGIESILQLEKHVDCVEPTGFIFHVSRCGSTLISNAMRTLQNSIVISESYPIAATSWLLFDSKTSNGKHELFRSLLLRALVRLYGQKVKGTESRYFVKFSPLETMQLEYIRRIWPDVPWLFVIRHPVEVIVSNLRKNANWLKTDGRLEEAAMGLGCEVSELESMSREEYYAKMIGRICRIAVENAGKNSWFIDYADLNVQTLREIVRFFGIDPFPSELATIQTAASSYSKDLNRGTFVPDSEEKLREASPSVRNLSERWAMESYTAARAIATRQLDEKGLRSFT